MTFLLQDDYCIFDFRGGDQVTIPIVHHTGRYSITIAMSTSVAFLLQIFYKTISISVSFNMSRVLENAPIPIGVSTLISGGFNLVIGSWWSGLEEKRQLESELAGWLWGAITAQSKVVKSTDSILHHKCVCHSSHCCLKSQQQHIQLWHHTLFSTKQQYICII